MLYNISNSALGKIKSEDLYLSYASEPSLYPLSPSYEWENPL